MTRQAPITRAAGEVCGRREGWESGQRAWGLCRTKEGTISDLKRAPWQAGANDAGERAR